MKLSWVVPFSLIDYPEKIACVVFTPWCNLRCGYCHNSEFVLPEKLQALKESFISQEVFFRFLDARVWKLQWVSICWGEPCMQKDLLDFCKKIKEKWFLVKLDTNGLFPEVLTVLLEAQAVDYIAMDIKQDMQSYSQIAGVSVNTQNIQASIDIIQSWAPDYEFRTTIIKWVHTLENILNIVQNISGAKNYYLQNFRSWETLDPNFKGSPFSVEELYAFQKEISVYNPHVKIRN